MNYVGIDISKYKHDCFIMSDLGEVVNDGFSFTNNAGGFAMLQNELELCGKGNTRIGFEATGNYGINQSYSLSESVMTTWKSIRYSSRSTLRASRCVEPKRISWMLWPLPATSSHRATGHTRRRFIRSFRLSSSQGYGAALYPRGAAIWFN